MSFHFSHPDHPLVLKEDIIVEKDAVCYGCNKLVIGFPTFTCSNSGDNIGCRSFYLHKSCAELPTQCTRILLHRQHPLLLVPRLYRGSFCHACKCKWERFSYRCDFCDFNVCLNCASQGEEELTIQHRGHYNDHYLTLIQREALFHCDACGLKVKEASYKCTSCHFWIHKSCASSPDIIPTPTYHHHPLHLIFSIPDMHCTFRRYCNICKLYVQTSGWAYYCHKCTYFVHVKCATSSNTKSMINEINEGDCLDNEPDLLQIPLPTEDSLLDFLIQQVGKFRVEFEAEDSTSTTISTPIPNGPLLHWSHRKHQLELLQFSASSPQNLDGSDNKEENEKVLVCNACIQPITASQPSYYACLQCDFFLHSFCATKLPVKLPAGASQCHPQHTLCIDMPSTIYNIYTCSVCDFQTNGFVYRCEEETCDFHIGIICAFLPRRIRHESHKHHPLVQRAFSSGELCSVTGELLEGGMEYGCETCKGFQITMVCVLYPSRMKHKYDDHPIILRNPPFFYEGAIYCEICEEEVNNQKWLYHCGGECDHSFHTYCLRPYSNVKRGGRIVYTVDNQPHTLTLVLKIKTKTTKKTPLYYCSNCCATYRVHNFLECDGCGFLMCRFCAFKIFG